MVAHQTVVLQCRVRIRHLPSPQLTANLLVGCHLGMALGCGLTSVRGNRRKNYENEPLVSQKNTKKKKSMFSLKSANPQKYSTFHVYVDTVRQTYQNQIKEVRDITK
jgi:hypothetical protein